MMTRVLPALCVGLTLNACADSGSPRPMEAPPASSGLVTPRQGDPEYGSVRDRVSFRTDSAVLESEALQVLEKQAAWLQAYPQHTVTLEGHADERGTREYNLALGERRAQAVMDYLIALGVDAKRLKTISYGKERPICTEANEACWSQNRRGVTTLDH